MTDWTIEQFENAVTEAIEEKLDKEKLAIIKKIGVMARKIAREQAKLEPEQEKIIKKNNNKNNANDEKAV